MKKIRAILFDLDGTLLDTATDLFFSLNQLRKLNNLTPLSFADVKPLIGLGSKEMLRFAFGIREQDAIFNQLRAAFFSIYQAHVADSTQLFPEMDKVLWTLEKQNLRWGIVTNKMTIHTMSLLKAFELEHRATCVICGDTLSKNKPAPEPILHACDLLACEPSECIYIGDTLNDVTASKAAGMQSVVALYGYGDNQTDPFTWRADGYIQKPIDLLQWIENANFNRL